MSKCKAVLDGAKITEIRIKTKDKEGGASQSQNKPAEPMGSNDVGLRGGSNDAQPSE